MQGGVKKVVIVDVGSMMGTTARGASEEITGPYYTFLEAGCQVTPPLSTAPDPD